RRSRRTSRAATSAGRWRRRAATSAAAPRSAACRGAASRPRSPSTASTRRSCANYKGKKSEIPNPKSEKEQLPRAMHPLGAAVAPVCFGFRIWDFGFPPSGGSMAKKKKVRVDLRKNRTKPPRQRGWTRGFQEHGFADEATQGDERVRAKGNLSRRRTI